MTYNETSRDWDICRAVDLYRAHRNKGDDRTLADFLSDVGLVIAASPPEQPAAAPATKLDEAIEEAARVAQPWGGFWLDEYSTDADRAVVAVRMKIAEKIRALKSSTVPAKPSFGEPVWPGNENDDLDKGDDA